MSSSLITTDPKTSATVSASAGTGKTWLLVTRLIRLLLSDARPDGILAVTFTRKAAAEMHTRLSERLLEMARCSDEELTLLLKNIDAPVDNHTRDKARTLYENLLRSAHSIRTSTFHSFCQDILRKFPLEAGIAPGFELQEATSELMDDAWNAICAKASTSPDSELARNLEILFEVCDGLSNTNTAINSFLEHRSDWWAFTEGQENPLTFAENTLALQLGYTPGQNPEADFFSESTLELLREFASLLAKHPIKQNNDALDALSIVRDSNISDQKRFLETTKAFLTQAGEPRKRKTSNIQAQKMGESGQQRFLELHDLLCDAIRQTQDEIHTRDAYVRMSTWYRVGSETLEQYQLLKNELRVLDFSDLEWRAYLLLNHSNNVHWIQYKLDQRIDHLLVDEFQDTNPTQWRLILPLLEELAAGNNERQRSVFLVGDNKQSIYRFRRADPELFDAAQSWLRDNIHAITQPLDISWRSANAIMSFVNCIFGSGKLNERLTHFTEHTTHHRDLWGHVELLPLIEPVQLDEPDHNEEIATQLRNPLVTPYLRERDQSYLEEGKLIAHKISELINSKTLIGSTSNPRPLRYNDIIVLIRNRNNVADYEQAFREAGIPYTGADRGALLNSLEIKDLVDLLELLITPLNNLALANVLRSPIFNFSNEDLVELSQQKEINWIDKLNALSSIHKNNKGAHSENIFRAHNLLSQWRELVGKLPVHDLLDRIYCEGDIINRYRAGFPLHLQQSVTANLTRFIELALEIDSGRHPTVGRFVSRLNTLKQQRKEAPDEGSPIQAESRVRIMTIHASKGLEAPVVFLADTAFNTSDKRAYQTIVNWPANKQRPDCFLLTSRKKARDPFTSTILKQHETAEMREDANLLYVAVTRARQLLYISGCKPKKGHGHGWYGLISEQCYDKNTDNYITFESGNYPLPSLIKDSTASTITAIDKQLSTPFKKEAKEFIIAPSYQTGTLNQLSDDKQEINTAYLAEDGRTRGIAIHRCLQLLCETNTGEQSLEELQYRLAGEIGSIKNDAEINRYINEAITTFNHTGLSTLFDEKCYLTAYNEAPIQYRHNNQLVYGIIDRLVITETEAWVIDYKTHRLSDNNQLADLKEQYRSQLAYYCHGVNKLWPDKKVRGFLLLTENAELHEIGIT